MIVKSVEKGIHNNRDASLDESHCYTAVICGDAAKNSDSCVSAVDGASKADLSSLNKVLGERYYIMATLFKRGPANMMSREEFVNRFRTWAATVLQGENPEKAIEVLCNIENVDDITSLTDLLN